MKVVDMTNTQILDEIEESWEDIKSDHRLEMSPQAIEWLVKQSRKSIEQEKAIEFAIDYLQASDIGQVQMVVTRLKEEL